MTKRECINYVADQQAKSWEQPTSFAKRTEVYNHCKEVCKNNGYTGGSFVQIWDAATRVNAIANGSYRG